MKFSIVTPAYKAERWLHETIESVLSQEGDFDIEYIVVVDVGGDKTEEIAHGYEARVRAGTYPIKATSVTMKVVCPSTRDGMYAALNEGFARATGDIHAWIPADDLYEKGAFKAVATVFAAYQDVAWLRGATTSINGQGEVVQPGCRQIYYTPWLRAGVYGMEAYHVDQPSVFWRAPLWQKGGVFPKGYTLNADYWLWTSFAKYERLWTIDAPLSLYRKHPEQGSIVFMLECKKQMWRSRGNKRPLIAWAPRFFFHPYFHIVPLSWRKSMERLYPFLFPHHPREYIAFDERGAPVKRTLASFISCS